MSTCSRTGLPTRHCECWRYPDRLTPAQLVELRERAAIHARHEEEDR